MWVEEVAALWDLQAPIGPELMCNWLGEFAAHRAIMCIIMLNPYRLSYKEMFLYCEQSIANPSQTGEKKIIQSE